MTVYVDNHGRDDTLHRMSEPNRTVKRFYRWNAPIYDLTRWTILRGRRAAVDALQLGGGDSVLEIGCGTGLNFARLRAAVGDEGRIVGVDLSDHMLARAKRRRTSNTELVRTDAATLALKQTFNGVLLTYAMTIMPQWEEVLARSIEHLALGGRLVVLDFGHSNNRFALHRRFFSWYLRLNHVHADLDILGAMRRIVGQVEVLRPTNAYAMLLRHTAEREASA